MLCEWNRGEGKAMSPTEGEVWGSTPGNKKKTRLQMVRSELFWSLILLIKLACIFFSDSGATPVLPEQLAAMDVARVTEDRNNKMFVGIHAKEPRRQMWHRH